LNLCLRATRSDVDPDPDALIPAYEDAIRELIGYCELAELEQYIMTEQIGGRKDCEEVAQACLLPLTLHLELAPDPDANPLFESSWRALHGDLSGIIVKDNLPTDGLSAHDMHAHMRPLILHAAALFKRFEGRQQCDLNPRNLLLDWNGSMKKTDLGMYGTPRFMDAGTFGTLHPLQLFTDVGPTDFYPEWKGLMLDVFSLVLVMLRLFDESAFGVLLDHYAKLQKNQRLATEGCDDDDNDNGVPLLSNDQLLANLEELRERILEILQGKAEAATGHEQTRVDEMKTFVGAIMSPDPRDLLSADDVLQCRGAARFLACSPKHCDHLSSKMKIVQQAERNAISSGDSKMTAQLRELQASLTSSISDAEENLRTARKFRNNAVREEAKRDDLLQELLQCVERIVEAGESVTDVAGELMDDERARERAADDMRRAHARCLDLSEQLDRVTEQLDVWRDKQDHGISAAFETLRRAREDTSDIPVPK
jgi:hypothetical protein